MAKATKSPSAAKAPVSTKTASKAKPAPKNPDAITQTAPVTSGGNKTAVVAAGGQKVYIDNGRITAQLTKLLTIGGSFKAVQDYLAKQGKAAPVMARGVESRTNPHSSKAVQDQRASAKPAKAESAPRATKSTDKLPVKRGADYGYEVVNRDHGARPGSKRAVQLEIVFKHNTAQSAKGAGAEAVDLSFAIAQGFIRKIG